MLFILIAKSGDERNKWTQYLQELTGKMTQTDKHAIDLSSANSVTQLTSNAVTGVSVMSGVAGTTANSAVSSLNSIQIAPINVNLNENIISSASSMIGSTSIASGVVAAGGDEFKFNEKLSTSSLEYLKLEGKNISLR